MDAPRASRMATGASGCGRHTRSEVWQHAPETTVTKGKSVHRPDGDRAECTHATTARHLRDRPRCLQIVPRQGKRGVQPAVWAEVFDIACPGRTEGRRRHRVVQVPVALRHAPARGSTKKDGVAARRISVFTMFSTHAEDVTNREVLLGGFDSVVVSSDAETGIFNETCRDSCG